MSAPLNRAALRAADRAHERARALACDSIDANPAPADAAWLAEHLRGCADCRAVAAEYRAIHDDLHGLAMPEPPRDLWARTSAGLDQEDASRSRARAGGSLGRVGFFSGSRSSFLTAVAVGLTVVVACLSLLSQGPLRNLGPAATKSAGMAVGTVVPSGGDQAPVALLGGNSYWVDTPQSGVYVLTSGSAGCTGPAERCTVTNGGGTVLGSITSKSAVSVVLATDAGRAVVWTPDKVVILPLGTSGPATVSIDLLTPRPAATRGVEPTPTAAVSPEETAGSDVTPAPSATPQQTPGASSQPAAILDGYTIVGRSPEFSPDGSWVAFAARPADRSAGPDVYVWRAGWERAVRVTNTHADQFAGWFGRRVLISEFAPVQVVAEATPAAGDSRAPDATATSAQKAPTYTAVSFVYDPVTGSVGQIDRPMLLPGIDPTGRFLVYWAGTVQFDNSTGLWEAGQGDLYFDSWSNVHLLPGVFGKTSVGTTPDTSPAASPDAAGRLGQLLPVSPTPGAVRRWAVRWDAAGQYLAVWVGDSSGADSGRVTLFAVDRAGGRVDTGRALLSAVARSNIAFDDSDLVYTSPAQGGDGQTYIVAAPQATPSVTPTSTPTAPGDQPSSPDASPSANPGA